jgi:serine/threonine protein kinase
MSVIFTKCGASFQSAAPAKDAATDRQYNFLSFLAIAQRLKIDFLPITWQPELDNVGAGGTAKIRQSLINLQTSFAFKHFISQPAQTEANEAKVFKALMAEISVLGHPTIRRHPNIIELAGICWDVVAETGKVWPVLVFEKAQYGDLQTFMRQVGGKQLGWEDRLKLCADVGRAVADMHSNSKQLVTSASERQPNKPYKDIIHGDIKPENVLIFKDDVHLYAAKLTDFGYSTLFASDDDQIKMPKSQYFVAPEWHHRGFTTTTANAMRMDAFSFGMFCIWLLFYNAQGRSDRDFRNDRNRGTPVSILTSHLVTTSEDWNDQRKCDLNEFFQLTLAEDPVNRSSDFLQLLRLLVPQM